MSEDVNKPVPRWMLLSFLVYFVGILPAVTWGLWKLISKNAPGVPNVSAIPGKAAALKDSAMALVNNAVATDSVAQAAAMIKSAQALMNNAAAADSVERAAAVAAPLVMSQGDLILAVMLAGALGSYLHGVNSFVTYIGNRKFVSSWAPWYLLRPFMGVAMAVVFYVVVRGGVLVLSGGVSQVDPYAMMTVAALAGMFSKQASDKLAEVFDTLFRSRGDAERGDKLPSTAPTLTKIDPPRVTAGAQDTTFTVSGTGFVQESAVHVAGTRRDTTFKSATELTFQLAAADLATAGQLDVKVVTPAASGGTSALIALVVEAATPVSPGVGGDGGGGEGGGGGGGEGGAGGGGGGAGQDAGIQVPMVVGQNANGSLDVISEATGTTTPGGTTDTSGSSGTTAPTGGSSGMTEPGTPTGDTSTTVSETTDPTSAAGGETISGASGTTGGGAATGNTSATGDNTAESLVGSTAGADDGTGEAADETPPKS